MGTGAGTAVWAVAACLGRRSGESDRSLPPELGSGGFFASTGKNLCPFSKNASSSSGFGLLTGGGGFAGGCSELGQ